MVDRPTADGIGEHLGEPGCRSAGRNMCVHKVKVCTSVKGVHMCIEGLQEARSPRVARKRDSSPPPSKLGKMRSLLPYIKNQKKGGRVMETGSYPLLYLQCVARGQPQCLCPEMSSLMSPKEVSRNLNLN